MPQNIMEAVAKYGKRIGVPKLAPHDLRRTFAKLAHKGRAALEQIQLSLGHASILTTERYLGIQQDLQDAPCDRLGIRIPTAERTLNAKNYAQRRVAMKDNNSLARVPTSNPLSGTRGTWGG